MGLNLIARLRRGGFAFPLAVLAALAMFAISETAYRESSASLDELGTMAVEIGRAHV